MVFLVRSEAVGFLGQVSGCWLSCSGQWLLIFLVRSEAAGFLGQVSGCWFFLFRSVAADFLGQVSGWQCLGSAVPGQVSGC